MATTARMKPILVKQCGFTLIEIVIAVVIFGILGSVGARMLTSGLSAYNATDSAMDALSKLRYSTERMVREFYQLEATVTGFSIANMTPTRFTFTKTDATVVDIVATPPLLTMSYSTVPGVTAPLTDNLQSCTFKYYMIDGVTPATTVLNIAYVEINITLQVDGVSYPQRTRIGMRAKI